MTWTNLEMLKAYRLSDLYRMVSERAGLPTSGQATRDRFVVRCGAEPPALLAKLLQEALPAETPEIHIFSAVEPFNVRKLAPGQVVVREGFDFPAPIPQELWANVRVGRVLIFAVEHYDAQGILHSVVWAAVSEEPPCAEDPLRAAVAREVLSPS